MGLLMIVFVIINIISLSLFSINVQFMFEIQKLNCNYVKEYFHQT